MTIDRTTQKPVRRPSEAPNPSAERSVPVALTAPVPSAVPDLLAGEDEIDGAEPHIVRGID